jgi:serine/threonine protein kinase
MARETTTDKHHPPLATPAAGPALIAGRYELRGVLGRGSMGTVHAGRDVVLDRRVAVKLFPSASADPQQTARYEQEARLLARLSHPNLVMVFDAGVDALVDDDPQPYLVMELVDGQTLASRIAKGPLPPSEVAGIASQLSTALSYIHRRGIIHRDIKPANILLAAPDEPGRSETAKLTDFGIARLIDGARMTMTGLTVGTANYLSPEQLGVGQVGPPSDVYALGLVLLEGLTGAVAYPGHGVEAAVTRLHRPPAIPTSVPDGWTRLLQAMIDKDPAARPTAADVGVAVTGLAQAPPRAPSPAPDRPVTADTATTAFPAASAFPEEMPAPRGAPVEQHASTTQLLPIPRSAARARRRPRRRWPLIAAAATAAVLAVLIAVVANSGGGRGGPTTPSYPAVPGQLGSHLHQLQQEVTP